MFLEDEFSYSNVMMSSAFFEVYSDLKNQMKSIFNIYNHKK